MRWTAAFLALLTGCATTTEIIPVAWMSVPQATKIRALQLDANGVVTLVPEPLRPIDIRVDGNRIVRGDKPLTEAFQAIESFDVSESRGEVAFSAKRSDNFDIGLVSTDGSPISWVPSEPVDETGVQWAPRGNKISFIVRSRNGDFVRTVHIPTATPLVVDFPNAKIETLAWDPAGDRFAVAYSTPDASDRVETMAYSGRQRKMAIKPAKQLAVEVATFAPGAISVRPREMQYNEKVPLVIWLDDEPFAWSDARAELMRNARVACIVARQLDEAIWKAVAETAWIDRSRAFVVSGAAPASGAEGRRPGAAAAPLFIVANAALPPSRYRRNRTTVAVAPAVVQSFAARFIADELKRTGPTNGSSR